MFALTLSNGMALVAVGAGYFLYSTILSPSDFAVYAAGLALAKIGTTILDGGLKTALIKHSEEIDVSLRSALFSLSCVAASITTVFLAIFLGVFWFYAKVSAADALFYIAYAGAYFLTYPFLLIPLAEFEKKKEFVPVARAEGVSISLEYGLPALLWIYVEPGFWSFIAAAWISRILRSALILTAASDRAWLTLGSISSQWQAIRVLVTEGLWIQFGLAGSLLRDSLHLLLVGPLFGKEWAGMYAWSLQLCGVATQVFVQTGVRVALPTLRLAPDMRSRWSATREQIAWITILTGPPLVFLVPVASSLNQDLFASKWTAALAILPFLVFRMLPSLAAAPIGALILVQRGARPFFLANIQWTIFEIFSAVLFLVQFGPIGLAYSYALGAWLGVLVLILQLPSPAAFFPVLGPLILRPSLLVALVICAGYAYFSKAIPLATSFWQVTIWTTLATLICYVCESKLRRLLART